MAQNYLYMLEFAVQELLITQGNECAPPEYPLNAEFTFRTGVYVSIPEEDFGSVKDESAEESLLCPPPISRRANNQNKSGKCCLFALEKPVQENENLMIHVYKKRTEKCKFLIGATEHRMKEMFDNVMEKFRQTNNGENAANGNGRKSNMSEKRLSAGADGEGGGEEGEEGAGEGEDGDGGTLGAKPASDVSKSKIISGSEMGIHKHTNTTIKEVPVSETKKMGMPLYSMDGKITGSMVVLIRLSCMGMTVCSSIPYPEKPQVSSARTICKPDCRATETEPCSVTCPARMIGQQPCGYGEEIASEGSRDSLNVSSSFLSSADGESTPSLPIIKPKIDRTAYDSFEADLNGCGLGIRVLKDSHKVTAVKRYQDPALCNVCKPAAAPNQKTAIAKLLSLVCQVLQSVTADSKSKSLQKPSAGIGGCGGGGGRTPTFDQLCECIRGMLEPLHPNDGNGGGGSGGGSGGGNGSGQNVCCTCCKVCECLGRQEDQTAGISIYGRHSNRSGDPNNKQNSKEGKKNCRKACSCKPKTKQPRNRGGCECDSQQNIMLFLQSIRQVVSNKKGLSDLADLLLKCTCGGDTNGSGDNKTGLASIFKMILEKIKECADDRPTEEKQMDLCTMIRMLTELQNNGNDCCRQRAGQTGGLSNEKLSTLEAQQNIAGLVKKILELGVKYCSNRNIDLRNMLCKLLSNDVCNEELTNICRSVCQYLEVDRNVICDHVRKETAGRVINASGLPEIRGTIKYPSSTNYGHSFTLPMPESCDENSVDRYRRKNKQRECCVQIDGGDIDNTMQGINQKLPNGIELCRKGTIDHDSDVFLLKMGKKDASSDKKPLIEIELKTPKGPTGGRQQLVSRDTQVDEDMLKERVTGGTDEGGNKGKGKGKGKGKKGKKGKK